VITGVVNADREPILEVCVRDASGQDHQYEAVVDTGYTGWLTLPPDVIAASGLTWRERGGATLADGSQVFFDVYNAIVVWDGQPITIPVDEVDADPLVGMSLMYGYELLLPVLDGATFTLRRVANP
jgi:clan AA aspartic protease